MIAVAFFAEKETMERLSYQYGITKGGGASLLGAQVAAIFAIVGWAALTTLIIVRNSLFVSSVFSHALSS